VRVIDDPARLPAAPLQVALKAERGGFVAEVNAMDVAIAALRLGAGRARAEDKVDPAVGVSALVKVGERIEKGETLAVIHARDERSLAEAQSIVAGAIEIVDRAVAVPRLVEEMIG
jgi:pyrimidine-nucleoside phosphorylase